MSRKTMFIALCVTLVGLLAGLGFAASLVLRISTQTAFVLVGLTAILTIGGLVLIQRHVIRGAEQESEASIRGFVETAWTAIITIDSDSLIRLCNPAAEAMFGYTAADVVGINVTRLLPSYARDMQAAGLQNSRTTGVPKVIGEGKSRGAARWFDVPGGADPQGNPTRETAYLHGYTARPERQAGGGGAVADPHCTTDERQQPASIHDDRPSNVDPPGRSGSTGHGRHVPGTGTDHA